MGFWSDLARGFLGYEPEPVQAKMTSAQILAEIARGSQSGSGARVDWSSALQTTTVLSCTRVIAEGVAQVPFKVYRTGSARIEATDHPLYDLLYRRPNPWQTSFEFRESLIFHVVLTGNAFVRKLRVGSERRLASLELVLPQDMRVKQLPDGRIEYRLRQSGGMEIVLPPEDVWHIRGPSWNTWMGLDATRLAREAVGLAIATEAAHADFHRNGARTSGFIAMKDTLTGDQFDQLDKWLEKFAQGGERAGKPMILDHEAKWQSSQMTGVDAEHLKTREFQCLEICRALRVMPIMVGIQGAAGAYDNGESMFIAHVVHTMMPWYERLEHSADVNLLTEEDRRRGFYTKFTPAALMRGNAKDRAEYYAKALGAGGTRPWMTQDEVRGLEELDVYGGHAEELGTGAMDQPTNPAAPPAGA
jgi:HK97 family phage portal protein